VQYRYSSTFSLTSALDVGGWSTPRSGRFTPEKDPVFIGTGGWTGRRAACTGLGNWPPPGFDPWTVKTVASCYTDCAIPAHISIKAPNFGVITNRNLDCVEICSTECRSRGSRNKDGM